MFLVIVFEFFFYFVSIWVVDDCSIVGFGMLWEIFNDVNIFCGILNYRIYVKIGLGFVSLY